MINVVGGSSRFAEERLTCRATRMRGKIIVLKIRVHEN